MRITFFALLLLIISCSPKQSILTTYNELPVNPNLETMVGKKVFFEANLAKMEHQHMIKSSFDGQATYICVEPLKKYNTIVQLLAYTPNKTLHEQLENKTFKVYGTFGKVTGAGKGGGFHTEYYLDLDKVE